MYVEDIVYFSVMGLLVLLTVVVQIVTGKKKQVGRGIAALFIMYGVAILWWFSFASDGLTQVFGAAIYGGVFVLSLLTFLAIASFLKKKQII